MKRILIIAISCLLFQSCGLFKGGKSKCGDCPTWGKAQQQEQKVNV